MARHFLVNVGSLTGSRMFIALSQILVLPILARHLEVAEFGDVALAMSVVLFAQLLSDAGFGRSLIRKANFDPVEWNSVFWLLTGIGLALAAALVAISPLWSWLFGRPALGPLVMALSVVPLLFSLSAVPTAMMERDRRFPTIASMRTLAAVAGFATAISLAMAGAGAWALIGQQIAIAAVQCGAAVCLSGFRPLSPLKRTPLGTHVLFARNTLGVSFLMTAQRQIPMMMMGLVLGPLPLGHFSMSQRIHNLPALGLAGPSSRVTYVHMAAVQSAPNQIANLYLSSIMLLSMAILPPVAALSGVGETAFTLLLSEPWRPAATVFALAAPGIAIEAATSHAGVLFQAVDRTELRLKMAFERMILRIVMVAAALPFGLEMVAGAVSVSALLYIPRLWVHVGRAVPFDVSAALRALLGPLLISALLWAACRQTQTLTTGWTTLLVALGLLILVWGFAVLVQMRKLHSAVTAFST